MNAQAISQKPGLNYERIFTHVLNWTLIAVSNYAVVVAIFAMSHIRDVGIFVGNSLYEEVPAFLIGGLIIFALVQFVLVVNVASKDINYVFLERVFEHRVLFFSMTSTLFAMVAWAGLTYHSYENTMLGTPYGHVRLMDDGTVLQSGVAVSHDPTQVGSVPVYLNHDMYTSYVVENNVGYAKYMTVAVKISADGDSEVFKTMLVRQDRKSLGWGETKTSRASSQRIFFMKIITPLLEPAVAQVFQEIADGKLQGGNDIVMLRLGDVFNEMKQNSVVIVPSWINTINVTEVEVTGWQQS